MVQGVFITGTDTGVGKTHVACMIIRALLNKGIKPGVMKPVETGCVNSGSGLLPADAIMLKSASGVKNDIAEIAPYMFELPLSPYAASMQAGRIIEPNRIIEHYEALRMSSSFIVVEGAGGLLVPICSGTAAGIDKSAYFYSDLVRDLQLPLLIVARPGLGTINHTLLTARCALDEGLRVVGVVLNRSDDDSRDISEETNRILLENICPVPIVASIGYRSGDGVVDENESEKLLSALLSFF
ncbi:MAG: dethiobiotin synthase [Dissulfurispiraceae bacterium]|jgi:dethiobiotin synthetase|nr:dethiobiotin synthase [Dissulfurispiraceae bacterium]